jgi:uncharacterized membrane protein YjjP (DUF1212 family)
MHQIGQRLDLEPQVLATPTSITVAFGPAYDQRTALIRVEPGGINLEKLADVDHLVSEVLSGESSLEEGHARLRKLAASKPRYGTASYVLAGAAISGAAARFFSGTLLEILLSLVMGGVIAWMTVWANRTPETSRLLEPLAATLAAVIAVGAACIWPVSTDLVTVCALIALVPGFTLTIAIQELATRHLVAGASRMFAATLTFLQLGFGVFLAAQLSELLPLLVAPRPAPVSGMTTEIAALGASALAFAVLFQTKPRDIGWLVLSGAVAYLGARFGSLMMGPVIGAFIGAMGVALLSNLFARVTSRPATILLVPGTILLVPGSVGLRSITSLIGHDVLGGVETGFTMLMVATAIVAGLLVVDAIFPARRSL